MSNFFSKSTITDLFDVHERGNAMGLFLLGPLVGPVAGPIVGGFINECKYSLNIGDQHKSGK